MLNKESVNLGGAGSPEDKGGANLIEKVDIGDEQGAARQTEKVDKWDIGVAERVDKWDHKRAELVKTVIIIAQYQSCCTSSSHLHEFSSFKGL